MSKDKRDLFDILGISTYEHSYTELLATLFEERQEWARDFFREVFGHFPSEGPTLTETQLPLSHEGGRRVRDRLDLVLAFGNAAPDIWVIEAKIKSGESSDQLRRYESQEAQQAIADKLGLEKPSQDKWHYSYLTLEGEEPSQAEKFKPSEYEPLCRIFPQNAPELAKETLPAYECLRERFCSYYDARDVVLESFRGHSLDAQTLAEYLNVGANVDKAQGLVDKTSRFHWLTKQIARSLGLSPEVSKTEQGNPLCKMRLKGWQGQRYEKGKVDLNKCFDVHLELHCSDKDVDFKLHYETNPRMYERETKSLPKKDQEGYQELRTKFTAALDARKGGLENASWKFTPQHFLQLAKRSENFDLDGTVGDFRQWVSNGTEAIMQPIEQAGKEAKLWE